MCSLESSVPIRCLSLWDLSHQKFQSRGPRPHLYKQYQDEKKNLCSLAFLRTSHTTCHSHKHVSSKHRKSSWNIIWYWAVRGLPRPALGAWNPLTVGHNNGLAGVSFMSQMLSGFRRPFIPTSSSYGTQNLIIAWFGHVIWSLWP